MPGWVNFSLWCVSSCEVIRDYKTKESLQYAFIEFEKVSDSSRFA